MNPIDSFERAEMLDQDSPPSSGSTDPNDSSFVLTQSAHSSQAEGSPPLLEATLEKSSLLSNVLTPLNFQKDAVVIIAVLATGLKLIVEDSRVLKATAFLSYEVFVQYALSSAHTSGASAVVFQFAVALNPLCECLNIFGAAESITLKMVYQKMGMDLFLVLTQGGVVTNVSLRTLDTDGPTPFFFRHPQ